MTGSDVRIGEGGRDAWRRAELGRVSSQRGVGTAVFAEDMADRCAGIACGFALFPRRDRQEKGEAAKQHDGDEPNHNGMITRELSCVSGQ